MKVPFLSLKDVTVMYGEEINEINQSYINVMAIERTIKKAWKNY